MSKRFFFLLFMSLFSFSFSYSKGAFKNEGIFIESYYPFGGRGHTAEQLKNPLVLEIAKKHKKTAAQIIVRWHLQSGYIAIPGSGNPSHIAENFDIWDFELTDSQMKELTKLNTSKRYENW